MACVAGSDRRVASTACKPWGISIFRRKFRQPSNFTSTGWLNNRKGRADRIRRDLRSINFGFTRWRSPVETCSPRQEERGCLEMVPAKYSRATCRNWESIRGTIRLIFIYGCSWKYSKEELSLRACCARCVEHFEIWNGFRNVYRIAACRAKYFEIVLNRQDYIDRVWDKFKDECRNYTWADITKVFEQPIVH